MQQGSAKNERRVEVFHCYNSDDRFAVIETSAAIEHPEIHQFLDLDRIELGERFDPVIEAAIKHADFVLVYLSRRGLTAYQSKEVNWAFETTGGPGEGRPTVIPIWLDGVERDENWKRQNVLEELRTHGRALCAASGATMHDRIAWEDFTENLLKRILNRAVDRKELRQRITVRLLVADADRARRRTAVSLQYTDDQIDEAMRALEHTGPFSERGAVSDFLNARMRRNRLKRITAPLILGLLVLAGVVFYVSRESSENEIEAIKVRLAKPQAMTAEQKAMTLEACQAVLLEPDDPVRHYPEVPGAKPPLTPHQLVKSCAEPENQMTDDEARKDVSGGIDTVFRDGGMKSTYITARLTDDPKRNGLRSWLTGKVKVAPFEAYLIAQGHNRRTMCAAIKVGRAWVNRYICNMRPDDIEVVEWRQHHP